MNYRRLEGNSRRAFISQRRRSRCRSRSLSSASYSTWVLRPKRWIIRWSGLRDLRRLSRSLELGRGDLERDLSLTERR